MSEVALEFCGVWKKFKKGEIHDSLRDLIPALTKALFSRNNEGGLEAREFWALQDVNFQVRRGEAIGVVGANGAGKSTILKLLSKILRPTRGSIMAPGRLSALIEIGAGFHPDLTGRENVYLNGAILGMTRQEISLKFDDIVEFAGISDFIDTPVKRYSSGMYARLGFSVAAHVDPEILLVDEVLSVGDMQFQEKCLERMLRFACEGTTVVFVSHNLQAVQMLCSRALLLRKGTVAMLGPTSEVLNEYLCSPVAQPVSITSTSIERILLYDEKGEIKTNFSPGQRAQFRLTIHEKEPLKECQLGFIIHRATDGLPVCDYNLPLSGLELSTPDIAGCVSLAINVSMNLLRGAYVVSLFIYHRPTGRFLIRVNRVLSFFVEETVSFQGICHLNPVIQRLEITRAPE
jgi:lipopolysaccharide transport system ATP-binding protein